MSDIDEFFIPWSVIESRMMRWIDGAYFPRPVNVSVEHKKDWLTMTVEVDKWEGLDEVLHFTNTMILEKLQSSICTIQFVKGGYVISAPEDVWSEAFSEEIPAPYGFLP